MSNDNKILSKNLKYYRFKHNFFQETLAEKSGFSRNYISDLENAKCNPSLNTLTSLANALNIKTYVLLKPIQTNNMPTTRIDIYRKKFNKE